jgi:predicted nucleic acid-binding protein
LLTPVAFWDASVLVPLCVHQPPSPQALRLQAKYRIAVRWATHVEMTGAPVRLSRRKEISLAHFEQAVLQSVGLANIWRVVAPSSRVELDARTLLERYPLRAADALQLAAALAWCEGKPQDRVFSTFDKRLREAAGSAGFSLE